MIPLGYLTLFVTMQMFPMQVMLRNLNVVIQINPSHVRHADFFEEFIVDSADVRADILSDVAIPPRLGRGFIVVVMILFMSILYFAQTRYSQSSL
jgi:hypothetical protein